MQRRKLSSNQLLIKTILVIGYLSFLVAIINKFNLLELLFVTVVFTVISYSRFFSSDKLEFDDNYLYIIYKDGETQVDLKNVYYVARRSFMSNGMGKIKYHYEGNDYYAQFFPRDFTSSLRDFKRFVASKNPNFNDGDYWNPFNNSPNRG